MKKINKIVVIVMLTVMACAVFFNERAEANELPVPKISAKYKNNNTGVKISIEKTKGANSYWIYIKGYGKEYEEYWSDSMKNDNWRVIDVLEKNGKKRRTYTIKGLPEGNYSVMVSAEFLNKQGKRKGFTNSNEITIDIKAISTSVSEEKKYDFSKAIVGEIVSFGKYEQDDIMANGQEDIEWIVLSKNDSQMKLISRYVLDCLPYNTEFIDTTWENSTLRKWLNEEFFKRAFSKTEAKMIKTIKVKNIDNFDDGTVGGKDTKDKVFIPALEDMIDEELGFNNDLWERDINRRCSPTEYAKVQGLYAFPDDIIKTVDGRYGCNWWLRTPTKFSGVAEFVFDSGAICEEGRNVYNNSECCGVRPVIVIKI